VSGAVAVLRRPATEHIDDDSGLVRLMWRRLRHNRPKSSRTCAVSAVGARRVSGAVAVPDRPRPEHIDFDSGRGW